MAGSGKNLRFRRLVRPVFSFVKNLFAWIEGGDKVHAVAMAYERQLQAANAEIRRLENNVNALHREFAEIDYTGSDRDARHQ